MGFMDKKRVLIIGGSRFSGKQLMLKLAEEGHEITVINRGKSLLEYPTNVTHIAADRMDFSKMDEILKDKQFDWVIDYIAWQGTETKPLIEHFGNSIEKFLHISTGNYYELENDAFFTQPIFENAPMGPITPETDPYSKGKRMIERDLFAAYSKTRFPMTIIRPTFIFGPDNYFERETYFFKRKCANRPILIPKPGHGYVDLIYSEDLADLCILALKNQSAVGQAYNASQGEVICGEDFVKLMNNWEQSQSPVEFYYYSQEDLQAINWPENKPLYPFTTGQLMCFSHIKAITELGFRPQRLQERLKQTFEWYKPKFQELELTSEAWTYEDKLVDLVKQK